MKTVSSTQSPSGKLSDRIATYQETTPEIRKEIVEMCHVAQSGHPGGSLSAVEYLLWLYGEELQVSSDTLKDHGRDRLVYSKGHACPVLYAVLSYYGLLDADLNKEFRRFGGLPGHSSPKVPGVEFPSGSLGQGLSYANGLTMAANLDGRDYDVYAVLGDGEIQEGNVWEAAMTAGEKDLDTIALVDRNKKQNDLPVAETKEIDPVREKFEAFGWRVWECDGHDFESLSETFEAVRASDGPRLIIADTVKGYPISFMEDQPNGYHAGGPSDEELEQALSELGFDDGAEVMQDE